MKIIIKKSLLVLMLVIAAHKAQSSEVLGATAAQSSVLLKNAAHKCLAFVKKEITFSRILAATGVFAGGYYAWKRFEKVALSKKLFEVKTLK